MSVSRFYNPTWEFHRVRPSTSIGLNVYCTLRLLVSQLSFIEETLHIGDQFLNTGNDFAARTVCPCVWITSPEETTYILKTILRFAGIPLTALTPTGGGGDSVEAAETKTSRVDFDEAGRRTNMAMMDVYTGEMIKRPSLGS